MFNNFWWNLRAIDTRTYFTIADLANKNNPSPLDAKLNLMTFAQVLEPALGANPADLVNPELNTLLQEYIWPRFYNESMTYVDNFDEAVDNFIGSDEAKELAGRIYSWAISTHKKYGELAKLYEGQRAHLMDSLTATSTTTSNSDGNNVNKVNDTPQIVGADLTSDQYTSTIAQGNSHDEGKVTSESTYNNTTIMNRLDEINDKLIDVYNEWSNSFRQFIIY